MNYWSLYKQLAQLPLLPSAETEIETEREFSLERGEGL